jgi:hypothetical protein
MLADDVRLELVNKLRLAGRGEVGNYFHNYSKITDWHLVPGLVDRRPRCWCTRLQQSHGKAGLFHPAGLDRRQRRNHPGFPLCPLRYRRRRDCGVGIARLESVSVLHPSARCGRIP